MSHTGTQLRIAASGPGAQRVTGLTDQTDNFYTIAGALGLATSTESQSALSSNAEVKVNANNGAYTAEATGFNGDAVLSYELKDKTSGKTLATSDSSTPVSGVRVKTAQSTGIALDSITEGGEYTLTVTGRQSGKTVSFDFQAPAQGSSDTKADNTKPSDTIASGKAQNGAEQNTLGKTGAALITIALAAAIMAALAMLIKTAKAAKNER